jgi:hypothetical protein
VSDQRKRAARVIMTETGWNYTRALREADRRHAAAENRHRRDGQVVSGEKDDLGGEYVAVVQGADGTPAALTACRCLIEAAPVHGVVQFVFRSHHPMCPAHANLVPPAGPRC